MDRADQALALVGARQGLPRDRPSASSDAYGGILAGVRRRTLRFNAYDHANTANELTCDTSDGEGGAPGGFNSPIAPSSNHPGGVDVGPCDGSVRFLEDTVNLKVWWAIGTRNRGEVVGANAYRIEAPGLRRGAVADRTISSGRPMNQSNFRV